MVAEHKFQNFRKFLNLPKAQQVRYIDQLPPDRAAILANEYQSLDDPDTDVWARMLERAAPDVYSEQWQPSWLRSRILATREGRDETLKVIEADDGTINDDEECNEREDMFHESDDEI